MKKIRCLIVDDEPLALNLIEGYVEKTPFLELAGKCSSAYEALEKIAAEKIDLLFLDIQMPGLTGMELSRSLKNGPKVVFTTAFEEYALEGFKVDAIDYLLKPFNYEEFLKSANKAREWISVTSGGSSETDPNALFVKSEYKLVKIDLQKVLYIEGLKDYAKIFLQDQTRPVMTLMSLKSLEEQLPSQQFMRIHRSFIVRLDRIDLIERNKVVIGQVGITIADAYKETFQAYLNKKSVK
ncbi:MULTISPECIES: LytTR family DNA-binding domain-containing protein [unclassified Imperialibacter]|jgi:DNA-binding LytR/AlgR family response regulator|uniref:LytR/AlgR family response regulator transcription factor n=1 Tax=unclassified Imperialibacter TaxID=2629706 RepID=UPI0012548BF0|nr:MULTISPECIES: LytTR family DNA-binding domain-containing protein [unclassified Imperialibacter]CAD5279577.1 DNA-binding response regulator [Imperialibacter sp. 75]CAD5288686.1 DNA-binding response regulator [Imperialibacter sp. 89]VVT16100.1 DNA-binding response regulator [Imperialibacter sp. EC-SDR9]